MTLKLYYHPLSSFCWKALIALYENDTPFTPEFVDLGDPVQSAPFRKLWPMAQFPVLRDEARDWTVPESSIVIEYLDQHYPGRTRLLPADPDLARQTRMRDRFFDLHIHIHMQKAMTDNLRPEGGRDAIGVAQARERIATAFSILEQDIGAQWAMGDAFTMADCAACPALFYGDMVVPLSSFPKTSAYLERLKARPSFARVLKEAEPWFKNVPRG